MTAPPPRTLPVAEFDLSGITHGGEAVGRLGDGKVCFVPYAIPGERVRVEVVEEHRRWARGRVVKVIRPSPDRVDAPCPLFGPDRCGGCQLQHIDPAAQSALKRRVLVEQLQRLGGIADPPVSDPVRVADAGYRLSARFAVDRDGGLGLRKPGTHEVVAVDHCLLLSPGAQAAREAAGDAWQGAQEVTVRTGDEGEALALVSGPPRLPHAPATLPVVSAATPSSAQPALTVTVSGFPLRVSATSFFQPSIPGAEALLALVREAADVGPGDVVFDLYAGVGLFACGLATDGARVVAVESHPAAAADARVNVPQAHVVQAPVEQALEELRAQHERPRAIVLDPPRRGAGRDVVRQLAAFAPPRIVYVSCDPAALARDARILAELGFRLDRAVPVDQFAHTAHLETVATFLPMQDRPMQDRPMQDRPMQDRCR